jgi:hypothetical protein
MLVFRYNLFYGVAVVAFSSMKISFGARLLLQAKQNKRHKSASATPKRRFSFIFMIHDKKNYYLYCEAGGSVKKQIPVKKLVFLI